MGQEKFHREIPIGKSGSFCIRCCNCKSVHDIEYEVKEGIIILDTTTVINHWLPDKDDNTKI